MSYGLTDEEKKVVWTTDRKTWATVAEAAVDVGVRQYDALTSCRAILDAALKTSDGVEAKKLVESAVAILGDVLAGYDVGKNLTGVSVDQVVDQPPSR
jgi:hypothetical protein